MTAAALAKISGPRGKIQCSYCQGLLASSSRLRPTVQRLIGLPSSPEATRARSPSDWRLRAVLVWAIRSQARAVTVARSRGGRGGLAPPPGLVAHVEQPRGPAPPPEADGIGMQAALQAGRDDGEGGLLVQE